MFRSHSPMPARWTGSDAQPLCFTMCGCILLCWSLLITSALYAKHVVAVSSYPVLGHLQFASVHELLAIQLEMFLSCTLYAVRRYHDRIASS
jgi:hypothetical protein